ncbi:hypothetical protein TYRP_020859 [Tyrophagus putrescentiae]|nr:hypothetical protein TYRP_020859 [Tyrophagus putrescentiae]
MAVTEHSVASQCTLLINGRLDTMRHMIISATPLLTAACLHCFALTTTAHLHRNCLSVLFVFVAVIVVVVLVLAKLCTH